MAPDPFLHELSALQQIDLDLAAWAQLLVIYLQQLAGLMTSGAARTQIGNIDIPLSNLLAALTSPTPPGPKAISALTLSAPVMGAASATVIAADAARTYLLIANNTAVPVFLGFGAPATVAGLLLGTGGVWATEGVSYTGSVTGITGGGAATLTVLAG